MNCTEVQELLSPYADGMLEAGEMDLITQHLATCSGCFSDLQNLQALIGVLKSMEEEELPAGFNQRLMDRLRQPKRKRLVLPSWLPVGAVAAILIVLFIGLSPGQIQDFQPALDGQIGSNLDSEVNKKAVEDNSDRISAQPFFEGFGDESEKKAEISTGNLPQDSASSMEIYGEKGQTELASENGPSEEPRRSNDTNGFRADGGSGNNGSSRYREGLFSASALKPSGGEAEEPISDMPMAVGVVPEVMRISVNSVDNALGRLESLVRSLGGEIKTASSEASYSGKMVKSKKATCTIVIPCSAMPAFVNGVTNFGDLTESQLKQSSVIGSGCGDPVEELQKKKAHLSNLLMHTSDAERLRELREEIASVDQEIVNQKTGLGQHSDFREINIVVEEKGN